MADFRRVFCKSCRQRFLSPSLEKCSLCGKEGGVVDEDSPTAADELREPHPTDRHARPAVVVRASDVRFAPARPARVEVRPFQVPPLVAAHAQELGRPIARFASNAVHAIVYVACGGGLLTLAALALVSLLSALSGEGGLIRPFLGFVLFLGGAGLVVRGVLLFGGRSFAFEGGLVRLQRGQCEAMRWQDVAVMQRGNVPGEERFAVTDPRRLSLLDHAGREWVFDESLSGLAELRALVEERTLAWLLPPALEALREGRTLEFGDVGVKSHGLTYPHEPLVEWASVERAGVAQGHVVVLTKGSEEARCAVPLFDLPNAHLLLGLIEHFRSVPRPAAAAESSS